MGTWDLVMSVPRLGNNIDRQKCNVLIIHRIEVQAGSRTAQFLREGWDKNIA